MGLLAHRDYDVKVGHKSYRIRLLKEGCGLITLEVGGRRIHARLLRAPTDDEMRIEVGGREYTVKVRRSGQLFEVYVAGRPFKVEVKPVRPSRLEKAPSSRSSIRASLRPPGKSAPRLAPSKGAILSPIPGKVVALKVREGQQVKKGDILLIIEAMKMENEIRAPRDGMVKELLVSEGSSVSTGQPLLVLD